MKNLIPYNRYYSVQYDYVTELPEGWQLLPNIAIFQERIERGFVDEELLSVTISKGVIRQTDVAIKKDSSNEDKSKYKLIEIGDIATGSTSGEVSLDVTIMAESAVYELPYRISWRNVTGQTTRKSSVLKLLPQKKIDWEKYIYHNEKRHKCGGRCACTDT